MVKKSKKETVKILIDNIADYADPDLFKNMDLYPDETEDSYERWEYSDEKDDIPEEDSECIDYEEAELIMDSEEENDGNVSIQPDSKMDWFLDASVWFNSLSSKKAMTEKEARYVGLMVIELSKFYFNKDQVKFMIPSVRNALREIYAKIGNTGLITGLPEETKV